MKFPTFLKSSALALAVASFGLAGQAYASDHHRHHDKGDAAIGIIGEIVGGAIEAEQAKQEAIEHERRCARLQNRCEDGAEWACEKYEDRCNY